MSEWSEPCGLYSIHFTSLQVVAQLQATESIVEPAGVADTYWHLHTQPKGVWTQELDVKLWTTKAWFSNSESNATGVLGRTKEK